MERFVGAWRLVAFQEEKPDGEVIYPYGKDAAGLLIYDASGRISVQIMRRDARLFHRQNGRAFPLKKSKRQSKVSLRSSARTKLTKLTA